MILLLDLSYRPGSLSTDEFVSPVRRLVEGSRHSTLVKHYTRIGEGYLAGVNGVILCGTALMDTGYLEHLDRFSWIPSFPGPVLGICAGMQAVVQAFGGSTRPSVSIGMAEQVVAIPDPILAGKDRFEAYELHRLSVVPPESFLVLARSGPDPSIIRHREKPVYGVLFHPEVRNGWLIDRFLSLCTPGMGSSR